MRVIALRWGRLATRGQVHASVRSLPSDESPRYLWVTSSVACIVQLEQQEAESDARRS